MKCPECESEYIEVDTQSDMIGKRTLLFGDFSCIDCGHTWSNEPDWDSMKGGPDYE